MHKLGATGLVQEFQDAAKTANVKLALVKPNQITGVTGAVNGVFIAIIGISSFVATLGVLFVLDGVTLILSHATPVSIPATSPTGVGTFAQIFGGGTYSELIWALAVLTMFAGNVPAGVVRTA